jgi:hypothetical protein
MLFLLIHCLSPVVEPGSPASNRACCSHAAGSDAGFSLGCRSDTSAGFALAVSLLIFARFLASLGATAKYTKPVAFAANLFRLS